ncbi:MAG: hypothetical protein M1829_004553 [Trizodia sp. TS-e1964]|nr:MAG: hypothetical protein M1829_004553 [Trizodia sp. TS-e1964]
MKLSLSTLVLLSLGTIQVSQGHTMFSKLYVDGIPLNDGTCIRQPSNPSTATNPVNDLASKEMACFNGRTGVDRVCPVNAGAKITFEFRDVPNGSQPGSIDISHKGPCAVYMKKVDSAIKDPGVGDGWFKIYYDAYDSNAKKWCTEKLIDTNGHLTVSLPTDILGGYYLLRTELLALHQADKNPPNPQFYPGCAQIYLKSAGSVKPKNTVSIPGFISIKDASVLFNIWNEPMALPYPSFGPPVYTSTSKAALAGGSVPPQLEGLPPSGTVAENANWCGVEVPKYKDEIGCWASSKNCWDQTTVCYNKAPPTGDSGCRIWEAKCQAIQNACNAGNFNGPPDFGKMLTFVEASSPNSSSALGTSSSSIIRGNADSTSTSTKTRTRTSTNSQTIATRSITITATETKPGPSSSSAQGLSFVTATQTITANGVYGPTKIGNKRRRREIRRPVLKNIY